MVLISPKSNEFICKKLLAFKLSEWNIVVFYVVVILKFKKLNKTRSMKRRFFLTVLKKLLLNRLFTYVLNEIDSRLMNE